MTANSRANYERKVSEHAEQVLVVEYLQRFYPDALFWSTPNGAMMGGGKLGAIRMNTMKREGLLPGVSDIEIFEPRGGYSAMFLEMKKADGGNGASENQLWFIREVEKRGGYGVVANGFIEAKPIIDDYLNGRIIK